MAISVARDVIVCPRCGGERIVTQRQSRRAQAQGGGILCSVCRGGGTTRAFSERDLRFWLNHFGAPVPRGVPARKFIAAGGAPPELVDLAHTLFPH